MVSCQGNCNVHKQVKVKTGISINFQDWQAASMTESKDYAVQQEGYLADEREEEIEPFQLDIAAEMELIQAGHDARNPAPQQR